MESGAPNRRAAHLFLEGTFFPARRASESPMAMACLRLVTFLPEPVFSLPRFISCISSFTFRPAAGEYLRVDFVLEEELFFAEDFLVELVLRLVEDVRFAADFFLLPADLPLEADFLVEDDFFFVAMSFSLPG